MLAGGEQGLLGLTFHPLFSSNRRFFIDYTRQSDGATVIGEYHVSLGKPDVADSTETVLLVIPQSFANHTGGMVEFGFDGFLYIGVGDGGSANDPDQHAQDVTNSSAPATPPTAPLAGPKWSSENVADPPGEP